MKIYLVGGAVRDELLGLPVKERDWVVVGGTIATMQALGFREVGKEFPVFLHPETNEEYALARLERKVRLGYKGFAFDVAPTVTLEEDLLRRDLTINAMAKTEEGALIDPYHGKRDCEQKILRHVSAAFSEDPVRILRVGRFLARYFYLGFSVASETTALMREMVAKGEVDALVAERVFKELERALSEKNPEQFFFVLERAGALQKLFPYLQAAGPGMAALQAATHLTEDPTVRFAALLHAMPEVGASDVHASGAILLVCKRYRVPNAYRELAQLVAIHAETALKAQSKSAAQLLRLLSGLDVFRREARFQQFLLVCASIAKSRGITFDADWLRACASVAKSYDVQLLIAEGLEGLALSEKLKEKRESEIQKWLAR